MRNGAIVRSASPVLLLVLSWCAAAQPGPCDPQLIQPAGNPYGYRLRGERCEGVYIRQVSSTVLLLSSFTWQFGDFDAAESEHLLVQWNAPSAAQIRVRARTLDRRLHYRMDAVRPPGTNSLQWPADLLYALHIQRDNLGILAWAPATATPIRKELYLPVRVLQKRQSTAPTSLQITLLPGVELAEVYISLAPAGSDGRPGRMIRDGEPLRYGYYPPDRAIKFPVTAPDTDGIFYLEIGAKLRAGGSVTLPVWFYNSRLADPPRGSGVNQ